MEEHFFGLLHCNPKGISGMMCIEHISCGVALNFLLSCANHTNRCMNQGVMLNGVGLGMLSPNTPLSLSRVATQQQQLCIAELDPDSWVRFHCCLTSHCTPQYHQYLVSPDP